MKTLFRAFLLVVAVSMAGDHDGGTAEPTVVPQSADDHVADEGSGESESAILRSGLRPSQLRRQKEAGQSPAEKASIADNCQFGMPRVEPGAGLGPVEIIARNGYVLGHSSVSKIPYWVCEHSTKDELTGPGNRENSSFKPDPKLSGKPRSELADYRGSGFDRGHMHPAGNAKKNQTMMNETHFLSNMVPQVGKTFNQGIWATLEDEVRDWTTKRGETWIISGPMFYDPLEENPDTADGMVPYLLIGPGEVAVPTHCYKIVLAKDSEGNWESIAFVLENRKYGKPYRLEVFQTTVDWIEDRTGLDFFPELSNDPSKIELVNRLESQKAAIWEHN